MWTEARGCGLKTSMSNTQFLFFLLGTLIALSLLRIVVLLSQISNSMLMLAGS